MRRSIYKTKVISGILLVLLSVSCRKDFNKISTSNWKPELAAPFIKTTIVLNNILPEDSSLVSQEDSSLVYFYVQDSIFTLKADTLLNITNDISYTQGFSLGELIMDPFGFNAELSMNDILDFLDETVKDTLLKYDGQETYFPPFELLEPTYVDTEPVENFINLSFSDGKMIVSTTNYLPVSLTDIDFEVVDNVFQNVLTEINIEELSSGMQYLDTTNLKDVQLSNEFSFRVNSMSSPGSFPETVLIDLSQGMGFGFEARDLKIISGNAKITEQLMYSSLQMIDFGLEEEQLKHIITNTGSFDYMLYSEMNVGINVSMSLPSADIDGQIPETNFSITPNGEVSSSFDISNMSADLATGETQDYNLLPLELTLSILPSDEIISFDSSDKINGVFALEELKLRYADGYLGQKEIDIEQDTFDLQLDFLDQLEGELILEEPSLSLKYTNSIGVPFEIMPDFTAFNTENGQSQNLNVATFEIVSPAESGDVVTDSILIDKTNSSIVDFLGIRPNIIIYKGSGIANYNGEQENFVDNTSELNADIELKIPLVLRATQLTFVDTLGFTLESENLPLDEAALKLNIDNGFPFDLKMSLVLADSITGKKIDKLTFDDIASAIVNSDGMVTEKTSSEIIVDFSPEFLENMKIANRIYLEAETSTFGQGEVPVVLYSDYEIVVAISFSGKINP